ncbi:hypothetical protein J0895_14485 [Phormidium pseudopriestleyi FRX01]|uniref:Transposase n=1 Tax=Phormidium pseudopriestleyi FRX01 TaxID=1759528 RepID=A0ABS3FT41_9CYAN|nr:hypothetical protein [Phormidium pseudopriestleyi]MBO0350290.1 hypothetical protein [Phormidium pseudopriestleyi FRX01]
MPVSRLRQRSPSWKAARLSLEANHCLLSLVNIQRRYSRWEWIYRLIELRERKPRVILSVTR